MRSLQDDKLLIVLNNATTLKLDTEFIEIIIRIPIIRKCSEKS
ncbi:sporulation histidine kinase inhibitor Sda [Paenibacillus sp. LMG 31461]|uniref:Sporulation histidine kinase inhibitor Sda n=1 Tax=Paenibacillus plantarum TaxID=2654975 RepID=A0ABX1X8L3_9BACL|nr:sporulation histidine kinase inhibitor Sda [Paenibacillus plantarum]